MSAFPQIQAEGSPDPLLASAAFEACAESLAIVAKGRVLYANRAFARTFGFLNAFELQGRLLCDFLSPECLFNAAAPAPKTGFASTCGEGTHLAVSCAGFRIAGTDYLIINARDIRQQKQAEQHVRESQTLETIGRLVGGVAHDFNNLLTGIMLYCDLLIAGLRSDPRLSHHAEEIRSASKHGANLIQQLLAVARNRVPHAHSQSLNHVIAGMHELLTRLIGENIEQGWISLRASAKWKSTPARPNKSSSTSCSTRAMPCPTAAELLCRRGTASSCFPRRPTTSRDLLPALSSRSPTRAWAWTRKPALAFWSCSSPQNGMATDK